MKTTSTSAYSLKTRITLFSLGVALLSLWALSFFVSQVLRKDMERLLGEQQFATASMVAAQINRELEVRRDALQKVAKLATPHLKNGQAAMQTFLEQRLDLQTLFNRSISATDNQGNLIAYAPFKSEYIGISLIDRDHIANALNEGITTTGSPVIGRIIQSPMIGMSTPVVDDIGKIIGVLTGSIDLSTTSFIDQIPERGVSEFLCKRGFGYS